MIRSLLVMMALSVGSMAVAQDEGEAGEDLGPPPDVVPGPELPEDPLQPHRVPFATLAERTVGRASKPVAYNWRRDTMQLAAYGSYLMELNTFNTARVGGMARIPNEGWLWEIGLSYSHVWDSQASRSLALTPYRQPGRPKRLDLDVGVALPIAEGVVTAYPKFLPSLEMVLNLHAGVRYSVYPTAFKGLPAGRAFGAIFSPSLSTEELDNLNDARLDAMLVDPGRYGAISGLSTDLYFSQGVFISPRMQFGIPLLAPITGSEIYFFADLQLVVGVSF